LSGPGHQPAQAFPPHAAYHHSPRYRFHFSEKKMRRYFYSALSQTVLWIMWGMVCLLTSVIFLLLVFLPAFAILRQSIVNQVLSIVGLVLLTAGLVQIIVGLIWLAFKCLSRPGARQYQGWLDERLEALVDNAHRKAFLGNTVVDNDQVFIFQGAVEPGTAAAKNYTEVYRKSSKHRVHYSINTYIIMFLTKDTIVVLSSEVNALNQWWTTTSVRYYYYEHISGVLVEDAELEVKSRTYLCAQAFSLLIDSGDVMGSGIIINMHIENARGQTIAANNNNELIQRLISLLKEHKMSRLAALRANAAVSGI
jgi:hypothetical protein